MRSLTTYALVLISLICLASSAVSSGEMNSSYNIHNSATITYGSTSANLVYSTSFEYSTVYSANELNLEGNGPYAPRNFLSLNDGGTFWVEDKNTIPPYAPATGRPTPRTGNKMLGLMVPASTTIGIRSEFGLVAIDGISLTPNTLHLIDEAFLSIWLWLPPDWDLARTGNNWYELVNPYYCINPAYYPKCALHILEPNGPNGPCTLALKHYTAVGVFTTLGQISNFVVPRGEWFNLKWWIRLHETNGAIKFWLSTSYYGNDYLLADKSGFQTRNSPTGNPPYYWSASVAKVYLDGDNGPEYLYADDLQVWDGLPTP